MAAQETEEGRGGGREEEESKHVALLSLLATGPFLRVAKSPPTWLPQKTPAKA